jgi:hypothetical protein
MHMTGLQMNSAGTNKKYSQKEKQWLNQFL